MKRRTQPKIILTKMTILLSRTSGTAAGDSSRGKIQYTHIDMQSKQTLSVHKSVHVCECVHAHPQKFTFTYTEQQQQSRDEKTGEAVQRHRRRTAQVLRRKQETNKLVAERSFAHIRVRQYGRANAICSMSAI